MDIVKIMGMAVVGTFLALTLKEQKPYVALALGIGTAAAVLFLATEKLQEIVSYAKNLFEAAGGEQTYFAAAMKITGISILAHIGSNVCKDAGMSAVASAVTTAGKLACICLCLPAVENLFAVLNGILP